MSQNIHDQTFKKLMSDARFFTAFCQVYLPQDLYQRIDWSAISLYKLSGEQMTKRGKHKKLREQRADVVYLFTYDQHKPGLFICNIEHQSTADPLMPLRTAAYACNTLLDYAHSKKLTDHLPAVISLIYYHGKITPYPFSIHLSDMFHDPDLADGYLFKPRLIDVGQLSDEEIARHGIVSPADYLFKHAMRQGLSLRRLDIFAGFVQHLDDNQAMSETITTLLRYGFELTDLDPDTYVDAIISQTNQQMGDTMTAAEQLREQGRRQGEQHRAIKTARSLLKDGMTPQQVQRHTDLPLQRINELAQELKAAR